MNRYLNQTGQPVHPIGGRMFEIEFDSKTPLSEG
jgi:hypothetical protein